MPGLIIGAATLVKGWLPPGGTAPWFIEPVKPRMRSLVAYPLKLNDELPVNPEDRTGLPTYEQWVEITDVYYILKGTDHDLDGSGGTGDLQLNFTVRNRNPDSPLHYIVYSWGN